MAPPSEQNPMPDGRWESEGFPRNIEVKLQGYLTEEVEEEIEEDGAQAQT